MDLDKRAVILTKFDLKKKHSVCASILKLSSSSAMITTGNILPPEGVFLSWWCQYLMPVWKINELAGLTWVAANEKVWAASVCGYVRGEWKRKGWGASETVSAPRASLKWFSQTEVWISRYTTHLLDIWPCEIASVGCSKENWQLTQIYLWVKFVPRRQRRKEKKWPLSFLAMQEELNVGQYFGGVGVKVFWDRKSWP